MFTLSKLAWFVLEPSNALALLAVAGLALSMTGRFGRIGSWMVVAAVAGLVIAGFSPLGNLLIRPLEERFPAFVDDGRPVDGIVVLGGGLTSAVTAARGQPALNEAGDRLLAMADLARRYPAARLVYAGGAGELVAAGPSESDALQQVIGQLLPGRAIQYERMSRNTFENARLAHLMLRPQPGERWLLVTSAWHMPRAIGLFRNAGWQPVAYPVDYRTAGQSRDLVGNGTLSRGLGRVDTATKEWVGLVYARLAGQSADLFPAP